MACSHLQKRGVGGEGLVDLGVVGVLEGVVGQEEVQRRWRWVPGSRWPRRVLGIAGLAGSDGQGILEG